MSKRKLIPTLQSEKKHQIKNSIYHKLQVDFAYNTNHIEGSKLSPEQTASIYDSKIISGEGILIDDIIETKNHFRCFDIILEHYKEPLTEKFIKSLHKQLKTETFSAMSPDAVVGDYKKYPNIVQGTISDMQTTPPKQVQSAINQRLQQYNSKKHHTFDEILDFHVQFEKIHPFYDGNGRVGRLIMFKECLNNNIVPFIITNNYKNYYYRGLRKWQNGKEKGYLKDTCGLMQDHMKQIMDYFEISYSGDQLTSREELVAQAETLTTNIDMTHTNDGLDGPK